MLYRSRYFRRGDQGMDGEIVLVTGGCGFLGQHVVKELQERDPRVTEIRVLDLHPYQNCLGHEIKKPIVSIVADVTNLESCRSAFLEVSCVIHCAALVSYNYPADYDELQNVNLIGTKNIIQLCVEMGVSRLVFTSTTEVTLVPYFQPALFAAVVNQTEAKAGCPTDQSKLIFSKYAESKLQAELLVLKAHMSILKSGDVLRTVCLRPTLLYGEEDRGFIPMMMKIADFFEGSFPRISGPGGKHQLCYAGNAAWAHICAKDALLDRPKSIGGLPIFITDDSPITDLTKFCVNVTSPPGEPSFYNHSWWYLPSFLSYVIAIVLEPFLSLWLPGPLPLAPSAAVTFLGSIILYNRLRADTHLQYVPVYQYQSVKSRTIKYYTEEARLRLCSRKLH